MIWIKLLVHGDSSISSFILAAINMLIYNISVPKKKLGRELDLIDTKKTIKQLLLYEACDQLLAAIQE